MRRPSFIRPAALRAALGSAARVRVTAHFTTPSSREPQTETLASDDPTALASLRAALAVHWAHGAACGCRGGVVFEFFDARGAPVARLRWHHGNVEWDGWPGNGVLRDGEAPLRWLAERGMPGPLAREHPDEG